MKFYDAQFRTGFLDPILISISLWTFVLLGSMFSGLVGWQIQGFIFVLTGVLFHIAGLGVCRLVHRFFSRQRLTATPYYSAFSLPKKLWFFRSTVIPTLLLFIIASGLVFFSRAYLDIVPSLDTKGFLVARKAYLEEAMGLSDKLLIYTTHLSLFGMAAMYFTGSEFASGQGSGLGVSSWLFKVISAATFLVSLLTTGRTAPLLVLFSYAFYSYRFRVHTERTMVLSLGIFAFVMFFGVAFALGKEGLGDEKSIDVGDALLNLGRVYFFSAPLAMQDVFLNSLTVSNACSNIFSYPIDLLKKLGLFEACGPKTLDFVFVPVATNVFTFVRAYWEDFGWAFPFAMFFSGVIIEAVYARTFLRPGFFLFIYPFFLNSVILQVFEEQLFANGSVFSYLVIFYIGLRFFFETLPKNIARFG